MKVILQLKNYCSGNKFKKEGPAACNYAFSYSDPARLLCFGKGISGETSGYKASNAS